MVVAITKLENDQQYSTIYRTFAYQYVTNTTIALELNERCDHVDVVFLLQSAA